MTTPLFSFLTPYWSGREMMTIHLRSLRKFHPDVPILISKKGDAPDEMEEHRRTFNVDYWIEDCGYVDALLRLLKRVQTDIVCIMDHDTVLFSSLTDYVSGITSGTWDLVGIEERIREAPGIDWEKTAPQYRGWMRFAPGYTDATMLLFNWGEFRRKWGLRGVRGDHPPGTLEHEYHYGICEKLPRHKYLKPFHTAKYGMGNLIMDGERPILWHQWYGSWNSRLTIPTPEETVFGVNETVNRAQAGEAAFMADYPNLDFSNLTPAWGPDADLQAERRAADAAYPNPRSLMYQRLERWRSYGARGFARHVRTLLVRYFDLYIHNRS